MSSSGAYAQAVGSPWVQAHASGAGELFPYGQLSLFREQSDPKGALAVLEKLVSVSLVGGVFTRSARSPFKHAALIRPQRTFKDWASTGRFGQDFRQVNREPTAYATRSSECSPTTPRTADSNSPIRTGSTLQHRSNGHVCTVPTTPSSLYPRIMDPFSPRVGFAL